MNNSLIFKIYLTISTISIFISLCFYPLNKFATFIGLLIGILYSCLSFLIKDLLLDLGILNRRSKSKFHFLWFICFLFLFLIASLIIIVMLLINIKSVNIYEKKIFNLVFYPINIISFIIGVSLLPLTYFIGPMIEKIFYRKEKYGENRRKF
ncbi:hypothetical protein [Mycoplasma sp. 1018B]|uniref:hypothetical protein n=1 Tax=Mycoplasma sp. 1018B TaxID=2967302 RepID=UPI00211CE91B|nr:hypothetical protein [Mycoplasma sp. 1018B]UUM19106.1 hypothetical protein NPA14_02095 [Mycoplasma sp. 1018B]